MKIQIHTNPRRLPYSNIHPDSAVRILHWSPGNSSGVGTGVRLGFPELDEEMLVDAYRFNREIEVCFTQVIYEKPTGGPWLPPKPFMVLGRVVANLSIDRPDLVHTRMHGFVTSGSGCITDSTSDLIRAYGVPNFYYTVTPGRVKVYASNRVHAAFNRRENTVDPIIPLEGWVEDHPKKPMLKRLHAVDNFYDLDYFRRESMAASKLEEHQ